MRAQNPYDKHRSLYPQEDFQFPKCLDGDSLFFIHILPLVCALQFHRKKEHLLPIRSSNEIQHF